MKAKEKEQARQLRLNGFSIGSIAKELGVSKSSVSGWVSDIKLTTSQSKKLDELNPAKERFCGIRSGRVLSDKAKSKRFDFQQVGRKEIGDLSLHLAGCMLYWGEGAKDKNSIRLTNYDPDLLCFFVRFLRVCFGVENSRIKVYIAHYSDEQRLASEEFWLGILELPRQCLGNSKTIQSKTKRKNNRHKFGGCTVEVYSTELVQRIYGSIKEYVGLKCDQKWLS